MSKESKYHKQQKELLGSEVFLKKEAERVREYYRRHPDKKKLANQRWNNKHRNRYGKELRRLNAELVRKSNIKKTPGAEF